MRADRTKLPLINPTSHLRICRVVLENKPFIHQFRKRLFHSCSLMSNSLPHYPPLDDSIDRVLCFRVVQQISQNVLGDITAAGSLFHSSSFARAVPTSK